MAVFEVFIPASAPGGFDTCTTVKAESWMHALRSGLFQLGDSTNIKNVLCDVTDSGIEVTDPNSGRVFLIRETGEAEVGGKTGADFIDELIPSTSAAPEPGAPLRTAPSPKKGAPPQAAPPPAASSRPAEAAASGVDPTAQTEVLPTRERFDAETEIQAVVESPGTGEHKIGRKQETEERSVEEVLGDLFEKTNDIYGCQSLAEASDFILDLAMQTIPAEAGAVFIADINARDLGFSAARGPKAKEVFKYRVPMGRGIVGFSAQEGVAIAVSDVDKDERFYKTISEKTGYLVSSLVCSPVQESGRVLGALELVNKKGNSSFTVDEINVLNFLAHEFTQYLVNTGQTGD